MLSRFFLNYFCQTKTQEIILLKAIQVYPATGTPEGKRDIRAKRILLIFSVVFVIFDYAFNWNRTF